MNDSIEKIGKLINRAEALSANAERPLPNAHEISEVENIAKQGEQLGTTFISVENPHVQELRRIAAKAANMEPTAIAAIGDWRSLLSRLPSVLKSLKQVAILIARSPDSNVIEELNKLVDDVSKLKGVDDSNRAEVLRRRASQLATRLFESDNTYTAELHTFSFPLISSSTVDGGVVDRYMKHRRELLRVLFAMQEEVEAIGKLHNPSRGNVENDVHKQVLKPKPSNAVHQNAAEDKILDTERTIESLIDALDKLEPLNRGELDLLLRRIRMRLRNAFGPNNSSYQEYIYELDNLITFGPAYLRGSPSEDVQHQKWKEGVGKLRNLLTTVQEELGLTKPSISTNVSSPQIALSNDIFIVHGHDEEMKQAVARILTTLGLRPVILHEQSQQGRTIIEKLVSQSSVNFAVILLSPDDKAFPTGGSPKDAKPRARQNVVFEFGFFIGKIGRERVLALYRDGANLELPSDLAGVVYVPYDAHGNWRFALVKELKAAGYDVSADMLL